MPWKLLILFFDKSQSGLRIVVLVRRYRVAQCRRLSWGWRLLQLQDNGMGGLARAEAAAAAERWWPATIARDGRIFSQPCAVIAVGTQLLNLNRLTCARLAYSAPWRPSSVVVAVTATYIYTLHAAPSCLDQLLFLHAIVLLLPRPTLLYSALGGCAAARRLVSEFVSLRPCNIKNLAQAEIGDGFRRNRTARSISETKSHPVISLILHLNCEPVRAPSPSAWLRSSYTKIDTTASSK